MWDAQRQDNTKSASSTAIYVARSVIVFHRALLETKMNVLATVIWKTPKADPSVLEDALKILIACITSTCYMYGIINHILCMMSEIKSVSLKWPMYENFVIFNLIPKHIKNKSCYISQLYFHWHQQLLVMQTSYFAFTMLYHEQEY